MKRTDKLDAAEYWLQQNDPQYDRTRKAWGDGGAQDMHTRAMQGRGEPVIGEQSLQQELGSSLTLGDEPSFAAQEPSDGNFRTAPTKSGETEDTWHGKIRQP